MRILILNWRDVKNPDGGGAEILTHEMAKRWVRWGHRVTQFSSNFWGGKRREVIDGVSVFRSGSSKSISVHIPVYLAAFFWYKRQSTEFDIVIDEIHGIPFFSTLYVKQPVVALICEVAGNLWDIAFSFPVNLIGPIIEKKYFRFYRREPFLTISPSTRDELVSMGVSHNRITVLPMGVTLPTKKATPAKVKRPTLVYVGRLTKAKGIEDAFEVALLVRKRIPGVQLWVIGQGNPDYVAYLQNRIRKEKLTDFVRFFGFVDAKTKFSLMSRAHLLIVPSHKEGWGLTVPEAGFVGTPSVAYDVPGLRDILKGNRGGVLVDSNPKSMGDHVSQLLQGIGGSRYKQLQREAIVNARKYNWDNTARAALHVLIKATEAIFPND